MTLNTTAAQKANATLELLKEKAINGNLTSDELNQILADIDSQTVGTPAPIVAATPSKEVVMKKHDKKKRHNKPENFLKLGGVQLQPQTEPVWGMHIIPVQNSKGEVLDIRGQMGNIEVAKASAFRTIPNLQYVTIDSEDAGVKAQCLWRYLRAVNATDKGNNVPEEKWRIAAGNIKKSDCVMGILPKDEWDAFFGCDVRLVNLWKVILPIMTPTSVEIRPEYSTLKTMRLRILSAMVTDAGYPEHDGDIITNVRAEFYRHADMDHKLGVPKPGVDVKRINCNWQLRASGRDVHGKIMPAIKAKVYSDVPTYEGLCKQFGFESNAQDAFITKDNLKTLKWAYKHGDILEIPIESMRNVKSKMKDWSSSMGAQCVANSDMERTREVLNGHGILQKADTIKSAAELHLDAIIAVMKSDKEARWDDALSQPVKCMFSRYTDNMWTVPRMFKDTFYSRIESYYRDNGIKVQIDRDGYYIQGDSSLDVLENEHEAATGELQFMCMVPNTSKFKDIVKAGDFIDLGRDPNVGPSNLMTFQVVKGHNTSHDCILMSWQAIYAMYGDVDGDTIKYELLIANTSSRKFVCLRRPAPGAQPEKGMPATLPTMEKYLADHELIGLSVLKSAADTGSLDLTTRHIIEERMYAGNPITVEELMVLSQLRQDAIDGLKHTDAGVAVDAKEDIIKTYGVGGAMSKLKDSPLTYRLLRKDAGVPQKKDVARFMERIKLINEATPHADHPYRDFFNAMKGIQSTPKDSDKVDSQWLESKCNRLLDEIGNNHKNGTYLYQGKTVFTFAQMIELGKWMVQHHKSESKLYLKYDHDARKEAFTKLKEYHRNVLAQKCTELFLTKKADGTPYTPEEATAAYAAHPEAWKYATWYMRQVTIYLGAKGFGVGNAPVYNAEGDQIGTRAYGKTGGALWNMPEECTLFLAELINTRAVAAGEFPCVNPYMEEIKKALLHNREKTAKKAELKAQMKLADMD